MEKIALIWRSNQLPILFAAGSILCFVFAVVSVVISTQSNAPVVIDFHDGSSSSSMSAVRTIIVDIAGGIKIPGVYEVAINSRVEDVIKLAGGLASNADKVKIAKSINRAMRLSDGMKLYIPTIETSHNINQVSEPVVSSNTISINNATSIELESLPGVGPTTAAKIITARPYTDLSELIDKKVVSKSVYEKIKQQIIL